MSYPIVSEREYTELLVELSNYSDELAEEAMLGVHSETVIMSDGSMWRRIVDHDLTVTTFEPLLHGPFSYERSNGEVPF